jgi:hypothetical protein
MDEHKLSYSQTNPAPAIYAIGPDTLPDIVNADINRCVA